MKTVVLGGYGAMGRVAVQELLRDADVDEVVVADIKRRDLFDTEAVEYSNVDVTDHDELVAEIADADCVANCTPFQSNVPVTEAAIDAETNLLDFGMFDRSLVKEQLSLNDRASDAGVTVVPGIGASPGISNVLVGHAASDLDRVREVDIAWVSRRPLTASVGLLETALEEHTLPRFQYVDGEFVEETDPFNAETIVEFPEPLGTVTCYDVPHPEPMTIPQYVKNVETVTIKGSWGDENTPLLKSMADLGFVRNDVEVKGTTPREYIAAFLSRTMNQQIESAFSLIVSVTGSRNGDEVELTYQIPTFDKSDAEAYPLEVFPVAIPTGIPMAVGCKMAAAGRTTANGIRPPEAAFEPGKFLAELGNAVEIRQTTRQTTSL